VADIAWAVAEHVAWSGDDAFARGGGRRLLIETARFWASRLERDADGRVHLRGIIGPDEYHELVDDNAFTNVMARWNLRAAAAAVGTGRGGRGRGGRREADEPTRAEVADWLDVADRIVDGYDPDTRIYEQFAGFHGLEPIRIADIAPRPAWADVLLGRERVSRAQVVKQTDVLLLPTRARQWHRFAGAQPRLRAPHGPAALLSPATRRPPGAGRALRAALESPPASRPLRYDDRNGRLEGSMSRPWAGCGRPS
jgi:trehalose/maltose hydrolase-like predicted phosphorylase